MSLVRGVATLATSGANIERGRTLRRLAIWVSGLLSLLLLQLAPPFLPPAQADVITVGPVCSLTEGCTELEIPPTPPLLNQGLLASVDEATRGALERFMDEAVSMTLADHQLPDTDADAVRSWSRVEAQAKLWLLVSNAIDTSADTRSEDQQLVVDWMTSMVRDQQQAAAVEAAVEYAKWAGLNTYQVRHLAESDGTEAEIKAVLAETPNARPWYGRASDDAGYCQYKPPAPYEDDYDGSGFVLCNAPCPNVLGCLPPTPSYDEFVTWGEAISTSALTSGAGYEAQMALIAQSVAAAVVVAGTAIGIAIGTSATVAAAIAGTAIAAAVAPAVVPEFFTIGTAAAATFVPEIGGATAAAGVGAAFAALVFAVVVGTLQGIAVFDAEGLPGKLAALPANVQIPACRPAMATTRPALMLRAAVPLPAELVDPCAAWLSPHFTNWSKVGAAGMQLKVLQGPEQMDTWVASYSAV